MNLSIELAKASFLAILSTVFLGAGLFEVKGSGGGGEVDVLALDANRDGQPLSADNGGIEDPNTVLELLSISEPSGAQILP